MTPQRIYILPTRSWAVLAAVLAAMWWAAVTQGNSAAYLLMFFLSSLVLVSAIHAHFALTRLELRVGHIEPVFAGDPARVPVAVHNDSSRPRTALGIAPSGRVFKEATHSMLEAIAPGAIGETFLSWQTERRGKLRLERLAMTTIYPLGFFRSWRYEPTDAFCLVYPAPAGSLPLPEGPATRAELMDGAGAGGDDYAGARPYRTGESQRHVDWRAVARGQPLLVKQFSGAGSRQLWLDYEQAGPAGDPESRLSQLSRWIVDAEQAGWRYGLRLPGFEAKPARGMGHRLECLSALALFEP
jgi:uncharacterized protein (DUF58 family)